MKASKMAGLFVAITIAAVFISPFASVIGGSTGVQPVNNTTVTADVGNFSDVDGYDVQENSLTVYRYNETSSANETLTESTDYEFNYREAKIKPLSGGDVEDGDTLYVDYEYQATDGATTTVANLVPMFVVLMILVTLGMKITN